MVVDASAIIALLLGESQAQWVKDQLEASASGLMMSTVNLAETFIILQDRKKIPSESLHKLLRELPIEYVAPTVEDAFVAGTARLTLPLNLGDCFAYALAKRHMAPLLTLDSDFKAVDLTVVIP